MTFIPAPHCLEIKPIKSEQVLGDSEYLTGIGEVVAIGRWYNINASKTPVNVGDTVFFRPHEMWETAEYDGVVHYLVDGEILGHLPKTDVGTE